jgi:hypothetical protein
MNQPSTGPSPDNESLEEILARAWARRAEAARRAPTQTGPAPNEESMTLDEVQARLSAQISRVAEARMLPTQTGPIQNGASMAPVADEAGARVMQQASPAEDAQVPPTADGRSMFTGRLQNGESKAARKPLKDEVKAFIIKGLACYDTPSQVVEAVNINFGITVSRQQVNRYNPDNPQPPSQRWRDLHAATRQAYLREVAEQGVAQKAVRLGMLDRMAHHAMRNHRVTLAAAFLEQAAKECGGIYENRRPIVLQVPVSAPAVPQPTLPPQAPDLTIESVPLPQLPDLTATGT